MNRSCRHYHPVTQYSNREKAASLLPFCELLLIRQESLGVLIFKKAVLTSRKTTRVAQQKLLAYFPFSILLEHIRQLRLSFLQYCVLNLSNKLSSVQLLYNLGD